MLPLFRAVVKFCSTNRLFMKMVSYIFQTKNLFHGTRIEIALHFKDFSSKQLYISLVNGN